MNVRRKIGKSLVIFCIPALVVCVANADQTDDRLTQMVQYNVENPYPDPLSATADTRAWGTACYALAALSANTNVATANSYIETFYSDFLFTETATGDFTAYFKLHLLWRIYCDATMNARLTTSARDKIEDLMWRWINQRSEVVDAEGSEWKIDDSENHDAMRKGGYLLCAQALMNAGAPYGPNVTLADGHTLTEHAEAWSEYFMRYFSSRASEGINVEMACPQYAKYTLGVYYNIRDFAESTDLRDMAETFITLYWADTASDWLSSGVRGGAETRVYKNGSYMFNGTAYAFHQLLWGYGWHENAGNVRVYALIPATSSYRVPESITACASATNRPNYLYTSRRFGLGGNWVNEVYTILFDNGDSDMRRETYVTPDYTMGTFTLDMNQNYIALIDQNRAMGAMFASGINERIMIYGEGGSDPTKSFADLNGVTRENCMVVQRDKNANGGGDDTLVFVSTDIWSSRVETNGWMFSQAGNAYCGVKPGAGGYSVSNITQGVILYNGDAWAPVVVQMGQASNYTDFASFQASVQSNTFTYAGGTLTYTSEAGDTFAVYGNSKTTPKVNGTTVDLNPAKTYDSPYLSMTHGENIATFSYGAYTNIVLDFSLPVPVVELAVTTGVGAEVISQQVARLHGDVTKTSDVTIYWDVADRGTNAESWANSEMLGSVAAGSFSNDVSNLLYGLNYSYRCFASNTTDGATAWSDSAVAFALSDPLPGTIQVVNTDSLKVPSTKTATLPFDAGSSAEKLVVAISSEKSATGTILVSYNGISLSQAAAGTGRAAGIWYLDSPYTGGTANLVVDMTSFDTVNGIGLGVVSVAGATTGVTTSASAGQTSATVSVLLANSFVMAGYAENNSGSVQAGVPLSQLYTGNIGSAVGCAGFATDVSAGTNTYSFLGSPSESPATVLAVFSPPPPVAPNEQDSNADGIIDSWTVFHFAADPFVSGLSTSDPDGDTCSNYQEYVAGTDPTNALDRFEINISVVNGESVVSLDSRLTTSEYYGTMSRYYSVESTTNMMSTNWLPVVGAQNMPATGSELSHTNAVGDLKCFYRARVELGGL